MLAEVAAQPLMVSKYLATSRHALRKTDSVLLERYFIWLRLDLPSILDKYLERKEQKAAIGGPPFD
jgi:hypothetical protein